VTVAKRAKPEIERVERIEIDSPEVLPDFAALDEPALALEVDAATPRGLLMLWAKVRPGAGPLLAPMGVFRTDEDGFHRIVVGFGAGGRVLVGDAEAVKWFKRRAGLEGK
jgi:hypothetical protein